MFAKNGTILLSLMRILTVTSTFLWERPIFWMDVSTKIL